MKKKASGEHSPLAAFCDTIMLIKMALSKILTNCELCVRLN